MADQIREEASVDVFAQAATPLICNMSLDCLAEAAGPCKAWVNWGLASRRMSGSPLRR